MTLIESQISPRECQGPVLGHQLNQGFMNIALHLLLHLHLHLHLLLHLLLHFTLECEKESGLLEQNTNLWCFLVVLPIVNLHGGGLHRYSMEHQAQGLLTRFLSTIGLRLSELLETSKGAPGRGRLKVEQVAPSGRDSRSLMRLIQGGGGLGSVCWELSGMQWGRIRIGRMQGNTVLYFSS